MGTEHEGGSPKSEVASPPEAQEEGSPAPQVNPVRLEPDYSIRRVGTAYQGVNLVRGIESRFEEDGRIILNHAFSLEGSFDVEVKVTGYGREGSVNPVGSGSIETGKCFGTGEKGCEDTFVIMRPRFSEWYVNAPDGLEQGFVIEERPAGDGDLVIEMSIEGSDAVVMKEGERIVFGVAGPDVAPFGPRIFYEDLVIHDVWGKSMKGDIELMEREIRLIVPDEGLEYPLHVDPWFRTDYWKKYGDYNYAHFGMSLAAGDFDHNGCDDLAVGSPDYTNGQTNEGLVQVFNGHSTGLSTTADWTREPNNSNSKYGLSLAACNFRNGWYDDLIVGAPYLSNGQPGEGRVVVYYGKEGGLCTTCGSGDYWLKDSDHTGGHFGKAVACGNFNGDSYHDLAVGIPEYTYGETYEGQVGVFNGTSSGLCCMTGPASWVYEHNLPHMHLGGSLAAGSFRNTYYDDLAVGSPLSSVECDDPDWLYCGSVVVFNGSWSGLGNYWSWARWGTQELEKLGYSLATGDMNNDDLDDLLFGIPYEISNNGYIDLYYGSASGLTGHWYDYLLACLNSNFGFSIASGNIDGIGSDDFIVGAPSYHVMYDMEDEGLAFFYTGTAGSNPNPRWDEDSDVAGVKFGYAVAMGDFDCDGNSDIAIGAPYSDNPRPDGGYVQVFYSAY
jgi:hypothetical protein